MLQYTKAVLHQVEQGAMPRAPQAKHSQQPEQGTSDSTSPDQGMSNGTNPDRGTEVLVPGYKAGRGSIAMTEPEPMSSQGVILHVKA